MMSLNRVGLDSKQVIIKPEKADSVEWWKQKLSCRCRGLQGLHQPIIRDTGKEGIRMIVYGGGRDLGAVEYFSRTLAWEEEGSIQTLTAQTWIANSHYISPEYINYIFKLPVKLSRGHVELNLMYMEHSKGPINKVRFNLRKSSLIIRAALQGKGCLYVWSSLVTVSVQGER